MIREGQVAPLDPPALQERDRGARVGNSDCLTEIPTRRAVVPPPDRQRQHGAATRLETATINSSHEGARFAMMPNTFPTGLRPRGLLERPGPTPDGRATSLC